MSKERNLPELNTMNVPREGLLEQALHLQTACSQATALHSKEHRRLLALYYGFNIVAILSSASATVIAMTQPSQVIAISILGGLTALMVSICTLVDPKHLAQAKASAVISFQGLITRLNQLIAIDLATTIPESDYVIKKLDEYRTEFEGLTEKFDTKLPSQLLASQKDGGFERISTVEGLYEAMAAAISGATRFVDDVSWGTAAKLGCYDTDSSTEAYNKYLRSRGEVLGKNTSLLYREVSNLRYKHFLERSADLFKYSGYQLTVYREDRGDPPNRTPPVPVTVCVDDKVAFVGFKEGTAEKHVYYAIREPMFLEYVRDTFEQLYKNGAPLKSGGNFIDEDLLNEFCNSLGVPRGDFDALKTKTVK